VPPPDLRRALRIVALSAAGVGLGVVVYPFAVDALLAGVGVRATAAVLLLLTTAWLLLTRAARSRAGTAPAGDAAPVHPFAPRALLRGAAPALALPLLFALSAVSGERDWLLLVPACVYLGLAGVFLASLSGGSSIVEQMARFLVPSAPPFIRGYCRGLTRVWAVFFALCALLIAGLALSGRLEAWRALTGWILYAAMLAFGGVEFLVRKTWFRYYFYGGPFDRLWSRLFPAEATAAGRRSQAYIRMRRAAAGSAERCARQAEGEPRMGPARTGAEQGRASGDPS
jgi:uncharacterized membrane protein